MKKIKITETQYRRLITEEEGKSMHPEIIKNKFIIKSVMSVKLERQVRKMINDEINILDGEKLITKILPIDNVVDKLVEVYIKFVPQIMESGFFECEVDEGVLSKLLKDFLIEVGGVLYHFIDDIGYLKRIALSMYLSREDFEKRMKQNEDDVQSKISKIIDKMFYKLPYNFFHVVLKDTMKPYKGTGCKITKNEKGWWGAYATMNDMNFLPLIRSKIINKVYN